MNSKARTLAQRVWSAGVDAVRAERLIEQNVSLFDNTLHLADINLAINEVNRILVLGAGKAAGYLGKALEQILGPIAERHSLQGLINIPDNCHEETKYIALHPARPAGVNEPRPSGVEGTRRMLAMAAEMKPDDLCICLLTGGGSALMPAPTQGISLDDKLLVTRLLSENGANIRDLNRIRTALSDVKGGGLARACQAGRLVTLTVSDVLGDPPDLIASGPTVIPTSADVNPLSLFKQYADAAQLPTNVVEHLEVPNRQQHELACKLDYRILANNQSAVDAAAAEARRLGLAVHIIAPEDSTTDVETVANNLVHHLHEIRSQGHPFCILHGGEPIVKLAPSDQRGIGGRNQQLAVAALNLMQHDFPPDICVLSGGTDGEDGPTTAAGGYIDHDVAAAAASKGLDTNNFLQRNDAFTFLDAVGGLLITGPTHTNVCDLRVVVGTDLS